MQNIKLFNRAEQMIKNELANSTNLIFMGY